MNKASVTHSITHGPHRRQRTHAGRTLRDWRLAALGGGCTALGIACLMLAACSATPLRPQAQPQPAPSPALVSPELASPPPPIASAAAPAQTPVSSPWERLRRRFAMQDCDYNAAVRHWTHAYAQAGSGFAAALGEAMPFLLVVLDQIEQRKLPGEFAFLPYIESTYTALASSGDRAAGIWQLMPDTAREAGLRITPEYDGRLDVYASTSAALDLLERYQERFGDWRLADMAFNAGPYRIVQLVSDTRDDRTAGEIGKLRVHAGTHEHLAKLLAVACIVSDPQRYNIELPDADVDDELALIELPAPVDLELAARLVALDLAQLRRINPGFLRARMPPNGPYRLLVPAARRQVLERTLGKLPQYAWRDWHAVTLKQDETITLFASLTELDASALAAVNDVGADAALPAGTRLLLPGRAATHDAVVEVKPEPAMHAAAGTRRVQPGDTLWSIAHANGVSLQELMRWNGLNRASTLHLGQRLRLSAPEAGGGSQTTASAAPAAN